MTEVDQIALEYQRALAALDPVGAFARGDLNRAGELTDLSPAGEEARAELARRASQRVLARTAEERASVGCQTMLDRLQVTCDHFDQGEWLCNLSVFGPQSELRASFDLMARADDSDWALISHKLTLVPSAIAGFITTLGQGLDRGRCAARRQALACAAQTRVWGGGSGPGFFSTLAAAYRGADAKLASALQERAHSAEQAYLDLTRFLEGEYASRAPVGDGVGRERYRLALRRHLGIELDLQEAYDFGWSEVARLAAEMARVSERIAPGQGVSGAVSVLEQDPALCIEGEANFRSWNQEFLDAAMAALDGAHFDIPAPVRRVEAMIAPPGGSPAMYYTPPSADFTRPGRTWYPTLGRTHFPLWNEVSTAYHEGVPGHHLQLAQTCYLAAELNPFQTLAGGVAGHIEGWALYAERLMDELGYLERDDYRLGMLASQAMRAARVVVDLGLHLELPIPGGQSFHPGERWSWALAVEFMMQNSRRSRQFCSGEVDRYLGVPAQAVSYKLGERVWLEAREQARRRCGAAFDLKAFHRIALGLGCVGLGQVLSELGTLGPNDMPG